MGKKDHGKNEPHGRSPDVSFTQREQQLAEWKALLPTLKGVELKRLKDKIRRREQDLARIRKGETHSRKAKGAG